jgi:hypothetical protein
MPRGGIQTHNPNKQAVADQRLRTAWTLDPAELNSIMSNKFPEYLLPMKVSALIVPGVMPTMVQMATFSIGQDEFVYTTELILNTLC